MGLNLFQREVFFSRRQGPPIRKENKRGPSVGIIKVFLRLNYKDRQAFKNLCVSEEASLRADFSQSHPLITSGVGCTGPSLCCPE